MFFNIYHKFYNKKITLVETGNGSDYLHLWNKAYRVFKVYENNELVYDRSTPDTNKYDYAITSDKTAIQKTYAGQFNRSESTGPNLISARGDLGEYGYGGASFPQGHDYKIVVDQGYLTVPADIEYASKLLIPDKLSLIEKRKPWLETRIGVMLGLTTSSAKTKLPKFLVLNRI